MKKTYLRMISVITAVVLTICLSTYKPSYYAKAASNEEVIYSFMKNQLGFNTAVASAALANIYSESGFNPTSYCTDTDGYPSYGICQWHLGRYDRLKSFCNSNGYDYTSLDEQLKYLKHEFETSYSLQYYQLKSYPNSAQGAYDASYYWASKFEVCAAKYWNGRGNLAKNTYWVKYNQSPIVAPKVSTNKSSYVPGADIDINWNYVTGATGYWIDIYKDGEGIISSNFGNVKNYTLKNAGSAEYGVFVTAYKDDGDWQSACSECCRFSVKDVNAPVVYTNHEYYAPNAEVDIMWDLVDGATGYWIDIWNNGEHILSQSLNDANCSKYTYQCTKGKYGVFVTAYSENGGWSSACSNCYNFYIQDVVAPNPTTNSNCYTPNSNVEVKWDRVDSASGYWIDVWKDGNHILSENVGNVLSYTVSDVKTGKYGVFVTAYNDRGGWTNAIADAIEFNVKERPSKPVLNVKANGSSVSLEWNQCSNTDYYGVRINNSDDGSSYIYKEPYEGNIFTAELQPGKYFANLASVQKDGFYTFSDDIYFEIEECEILGDCNKDGEFNISDVVLLQKWLLAEPDIELINWKAADLCEDDRLDVFDLCLMKRMLVENG